MLRKIFDRQFGVKAPENRRLTDEEEKAAAFILEKVKSIAVTLNVDMFNTMGLVIALMRTDKKVQEKELHRFTSFFPNVLQNEQTISEVRKIIAEIRPGIESLVDTRSKGMSEETYIVSLFQTVMEYFSYTGAYKGEKKEAENSRE